MAEVKLKNGYIKISNSLFENICNRKFTLNEIKIVLTIVRLSYGFNSKTAYVKHKSLLSACGVQKQYVYKTVSGLVFKKVIKDLGNGEYALNKNYDEWAVSFPKSYDTCKLNILKIMQKGTKLIPNEVLKQDLKGYQNNTEKDTELIPNEVLKQDPQNYMGYQINTEKGINLIPNEVLKQDPQKPENASDNGNTDAPKNNKDNKDNINIHTLLIAGKEVAENVCVILKNYAKKMGAKNIDAYIASLVKNDAHMKIFEEETKKKEQAEVIKKANTYIPPWKMPDFVPATPEEVEEINKRFKEKMRNRGKNENS